MTIITTQAQISEASNADLLETYNALTGKAVKKFSSRAAAESQVSNAILGALDKAGHAGVAKGEEPKIKVEGNKVVAAEGVTGKQVEKAKAVKGEKIAKVIEKAKVPTKKVAAKKAPVAKKERAASPGRAATYTHVRLTDPDSLRRPQADSMRTKVLNALQSQDAKMKKDGLRPAQRVISIEALSKHVGFNARSFVHKLAFQGWCEVAPA